MKSKLVSLLLCFFLGNLGVHRFYLGKIGTGILYLLTFGFCGIGTFIDLIRIATNNLKDKSGYDLNEDIPAFVAWLVVGLPFFIMLIGIGAGIFSVAKDVVNATSDIGKPTGHGNYSDTTITEEEDNTNELANNELKVIIDKFTSTDKIYDNINVFKGIVSEIETFKTNYPNYDNMGSVDETLTFVNETIAELEEKNLEDLDLLLDEYKLRIDENEKYYDVLRDILEELESMSDKYIGNDKYEDVLTYSFEAYLSRVVDMTDFWMNFDLEYTNYDEYKNLTDKEAMLLKIEGYKECASHFGYILENYPDYEYIEEVQATKDSIDIYLEFAKLIYG